MTMAFLMSSPMKIPIWIIEIVQQKYANRWSPLNNLENNVRRLGGGGVGGLLYPPSKYGADSFSFGYGSW